MVPKTLANNLKWRKTLRDEARANLNVRSALLSASQKSYLFWVNAFGWTYRQRYVRDDGEVVPVMGDEAHTPFITWPVQDEASMQMIECIETGEDINVEKSRDMGATWLVLSVFSWLFLFRKNQDFGVVSRKESLVDSSGDMDSLFEKLRYTHRMLPEWMLPPIKSRYMHMKNEELGGTIAGESTNADVGRGGRKVAYAVDEAAAIDNGQDIEFSLSQNTACQIWLSTAHGPSTQFHARLKEKRGRIFQMPWYRHPQKSIGARQIRDGLGTVKWTSLWYEKQCERMSSKAVAQEIDMDHGKAGDIFFDYAELERHRQDHLRDPLVRGDLIMRESMTQEKQIEAIQQMKTDTCMFIRNRGRSPWRFWCNLEEGRPPQHYTYVFGIDIANGSGNSNSVISVLALEPGMIVAKFWDAYTTPEELALHAAMAGVWFGGLRAPAFLVWENNGPGGIFGQKINRMRYPLYYLQRMDNTTKNSRTPRWGWHSNKERKEVLLGRYRDSLATDSIVNPCRESLDEAQDYIYNDSGLLIPAKLREEAGGGRELHGDHVIADALTVLGRDEMPKRTQSVHKAIPGTYAHRQESFRKRRKEATRWL